MPIYKSNAITHLIDTKGFEVLSETPTRQESVMQGELFNVYRDSLSILEPKPVVNAIRYTDSKNKWNNYGMWGSSKNGRINQYAKGSWDPGKVINIDFGVLNIGSEHSLPHPAIVLADIMNLLIVVPMTGELNDNGNIKDFPDDIEAVVMRVKKNDSRLIEQNADGTQKQWLLKKDSVILTHQIRVVSKNRITAPFRVKLAGDEKTTVLNIANTPLMKELEHNAARLLGAGAYRELLATITDLRTQLSDKDKEIGDLKSELQSQKDAYLQLMKELRETQVVAEIEEM